MIPFIIICIAVFIVLIFVLSDKSDKEKEKDLLLKKIASEKAYLKEYGCSMDEMRERIKNSSAVKIIASRIKERLQCPEKIEVRPESLIYAYNAHPILYFSELGLSNIPYGCTGVLCEELAKELQSFAPYKYVQEDFGDYLVVEKAKEHSVNGW